MKKIIPACLLVCTFKLYSGCESKLEKSKEIEEAKKDTITKYIRQKAAEDSAAQFMKKLREKNEALIRRGY